jgi:hypothetical protein
VCETTSLSMVLAGPPAWHDPPTAHARGCGSDALLSTIAACSNIVERTVVITARTARCQARALYYPRRAGPCNTAAGGRATTGPGIRTSGGLMSGPSLPVPWLPAGDVIAATACLTSVVRAPILNGNTR